MIIKELVTISYLKQLTEADRVKNKNNQYLFLFINVFKGS